MDSQEIMRLLGSIEGRLGALERNVDQVHNGVERANDRLDAHAKGGAISGGLVALGVSLIAEFVKRGVTLS